MLQDFLDKIRFPTLGPTTRSENLWPKLNYGQDLVAKDVVIAFLLLVFLRVANVHFVLHAFVQASRCSYRTWSYVETFRRWAAMTTPGLA